MNQIVSIISCFSHTRSSILKNIRQFIHFWDNNMFLFRVRHKISFILIWLFIVWLIHRLWSNRIFQKIWIILILFNSDRKNRFSLFFIICSMASLLLLSLIHLVCIIIGMILLKISFNSMINFMQIMRFSCKILKMF